MSQPVKKAFKVYQGSTFNEVLRCESSKKIYKPITSITQSAPVVISVANHGVKDGQRVKITNVGGMTEINSTETYHLATVLTSGTIEINNINSIDYKAYTSGGILEYNEPVDLTGCTARMQIREKIDSTTFIKELTTENNGISIDVSTSKITINIDAVDTAAFDFTSAVYSLELVYLSGVVKPLMNGTLTLVKEVTR